MRLLIALALAAVAAAPAATQPTPLIGAAELEQALDRLNTLGSALMLAAHPDDENTAVISYLARGRHLRTGYISATRGEGGQNLIGTEQGALMGLIRTQELLEARRVDGGEQFFTRAIDFGYSKTPEEAYAQWGRETLLGDMVRVIRRFRPDVLISRFPPPPGSGGHGQHTAVGHIAREAFEAAADPARFPEQIEQGLEPWRAKRLVWNVFQFGRPRPQGGPAPEGRIRLEIGDYDPVLGKSYSEIAGESRSMHRSQGMGTSQPKGARDASFDPIAGDAAESDLFDGVDTTWDRVPGGEAVGKRLARARDEYDPRKPEAILPHLLTAYEEMEALEGYWPDVKRGELKRAVELAAGLWLDATAERWDAVPGEKLTINWSVVNRSQAEVELVGAGLAGAVEGAGMEGGKRLAYNQPVEARSTVDIPADAPYSQPPWLRQEPSGSSYALDDPELIGRPEAPPVLEARFTLRFSGGVEIPFRKPVVYRWVDRSFGERERALEVVPAVAVNMTRDNLVFPSSESREVAVTFVGHVDEAEGVAGLKAPKGWKVEPQSAPVSLTRRGQETTVSFRVTPPAEPSGGMLHASVTIGGREIANGLREIEYDHIPMQVVYPPAEVRVERVDVTMLSKSIGYIMGAGDRIPEALQELGATVTLLGPADLAAGDLAQYDAIVAGVRALNTRPDLAASRERLLEYVRGGGTLIVQYNTFARRGPQPILGPYPMKTPQRSFERTDRVTYEDAPILISKPDHPLLQAPNRITEADFEGWVQERGLYFMGEWDERYESVFASHDPGQEPQGGGMLYTRYGEGVYIFTGYSWFRQLPAGVPGAYRLFANMVSAGKVVD